MPTIESDAPTGKWDSPLFKVLQLKSAEQWEALRDLYTVQQDRTEEAFNLTPWYRCLHVARAAGAVSVVIELRYIDHDYRSEHGSFYSQLLAGVEPSTHRLHFFRKKVKSSQCGSLSSAQIKSYAGYVICRPRGLELVGRTVLLPPKGLKVRTSISDIVTLFGQRLEAFGVPFMQQDQRLAVCAHAALWSIHYTAYARQLLQRRSIADIVSAAHGSSFADGQDGLNIYEATNVLRGFGLRATHLRADYTLLPGLEADWMQSHIADTSKLTKDEIDTLNVSRAVMGAVAPSLNSRMPVYVAAAEHAFIVCGYQREADRTMTYIVNDDQIGPYLAVKGPFGDFTEVRLSQSPREFPARRRLPVDKTTPDMRTESLQWENLVIPFPPMVYLSRRAAERKAIGIFGAALKAVGEQLDSSLANATTDQTLDIRVYTVRGSQYKQTLSSREVPNTAAAHIHMMRTSRFVHVAELIDTTIKGQDQRVVGEIVFDSTSREKAPAVLSLRLGKTLQIAKSDGEILTFAVDFEKAYTGSPGALIAEKVGTLKRPLAAAGTDV